MTEQAVETPDQPLNQGPATQGPDLSESDWQITWRQFKKNKVGLVGLVVVYLLFAVAVFAPLMANGRPYHLRGVITLFYDSDVTAWRAMHDKTLRLSKILKDETENGQPLEREDLRKYQGQLATTKDKIDSIFSRLEDFLPSRQLRTFEDQRDAYNKLLQQAPKDFNAKEFDAVGQKFDVWLSGMSYKLIYKKATAASLTLEQKTLRPMRQAQDDYSFAIDEEEEDTAETAKKAYDKAAGKLAGFLSDYEQQASILKMFLNDKQKQRLEALTGSVLKSLRTLPKTVPEDSSSVVQPIREFTRANRNFDKEFAHIAIEPKRQRLPSRDFYPMVRYLSWGEVFFMALFLCITLAFVLIRAGTLPVNMNSMWLVGILPAVLIALIWGLLNPLRNPPPDSYYKRFYNDIKDRRAKFLADKKAGKVDGAVPDFGTITLAMVPFGENENISKDSKVPPTWSESYSSKRNRLLSDSEKALERTLFQVPQGWRLITDGPKKPGEKQPVASSGGIFELPHSRNPKKSAYVRAFPLKKARFKGQLASTPKDWNQRFEALFESDDVTVLKYKTSLGELEIVQLEQDGQIDAYARLSWLKGYGPKDGPWGFELKGPRSTVGAWWGSFATYPQRGSSSMTAEVERRLNNPIRYHHLGTDENGRDILARMIYGSRVSLSVGFIAVAIYVFIGIIVGALAGYFGGWVDIMISRVIEVVICFPSFFLIITVLAMLPPSIFNIMVVIGITRWTGVARLIRGEFLRLVNLDYVVACKALGFTPTRTIFRHIVPNALAPVLVAATFGVAGAILTESALSYLGFGVPQPQASWGSILQEASKDPKQLWWITVFPGLAIFITITAYNIVGEAFRDASDPKLRK